jgi:hypothetical protein
VATVTGLKGTLTQRVKKFENRASSALSTLEEYARKNDIFDWLDLRYAKPYPDDPGHFRRLNYVYQRVVESLNKLTPDKLKKDNISSFPLYGKKPADLLQKYKDKFQAREKKEMDKGYEFVTPPFHLADVVRRLRIGSELGPLLVSSLDPELFTACYIHKCLNSDLLPEERVLLYKRIWHEVFLYVTGECSYHDLSTLWWGINIVTRWETTKLEDDTPNLEGKIEAVRKLLEKSLSYDQHTWDLLKKGLLTGDWLQRTSYDRNGDLVTPHRSLVYCYQNAVAVRTWLEKLRDPRLLPLIETIRGWADSCANIWLDKNNNIGPRLYNAALDLSLCAEWWKDRVSHWKEAINILDKGVSNYKNKSPLKTIATTDDEFSERLKRVKTTVQKFRDSDNEKRPLVVALFGPPGTGKSKVAKAIDEESLIELNLAVFDTPKELFTTLSKDLEKKKGKIKKPILFLDEFDIRLGNEYWYRWLLTLLWDAKFPVVDKPDWVEMKPIPLSSVVFLAASRYERYDDFRDSALTPEAKDHKAADLLTRIDVSLNMLRLKPAERALVMDSIAKEYRGEAKKDLLALCYMAEFEDNARGVRKLLKGVNLNSKFGLNNLTSASKERLYKTAGLPT